MSKNRPTLTPQRIFSIYREMKSWRRLYFDDKPCDVKSKTINGAIMWEWLADCNPETVKIRFDRNLDKIDQRVAFVLRLDPHVHLISSRIKFEKAKMGVWFTNFVLAHELAHIFLEHSEATTAAKPFSLHSENGVLKALAADTSEMEAHYGAIFLQVGDQIFEKNFDVSAVLRSAATDEVTLRRLAKICQLDSMQQLWAESQKINRAVF